MFFLDGVLFPPSMVMISISAVIPYFLNQLGATTFQIALATSMTMICMFITQPFFGYVASKSAVMNKTFFKILLTQRLSFLVFILLIPVFARSDSLLVVVFLIFWGIFCAFTGSYAVFYGPLMLKLLPPNKRGTIRGIGFAVGSFIGVGLSALIPVILSRIVFPYNYMTIFFIGISFTLANSIAFKCMRQTDDMPPNEPMSMTQYLRQMPSTVRENPPFRAVILTCLFLTIANSLVPYYTLSAIRTFSATETHIAILSGLAIFTTAISYTALGYLVDRRGPRIATAIVAGCVITGGALALTTNSLGFLFAAWVFANLGHSGLMLVASILLGEVSPPTKLPLYVGVHFTISMALSSAVVLLLAPVLEAFGFNPLFTIVLICGLLSLLLNIFVLRKMLGKKSGQEVT
jgi:MFS family permease